MAAILYRHQCVKYYIIRCHTDSSLSVNLHTSNAFLNFADSHVLFHASWWPMWGTNLTAIDGQTPDKTSCMGIRFWNFPSFIFIQWMLPREHSLNKDKRWGGAGDLVGEYRHGCWWWNDMVVVVVVGWWWARGGVKKLNFGRGCSRKKWKRGGGGGGGWWVGGKEKRGLTPGVQIPLSFPTVQVMACRRTGGKSVRVPMMILSTDACMRRRVSQPSLVTQRCSWRRDTSRRQTTLVEIA